MTDSYFKADDATIDHYVSEYHAGYLIGQLAREVKELRAAAKVRANSEGDGEAWNEFTDAHRRHFPYPDGTEIEVTGRDTHYRSDFSKVMRVRSPQWNGHAPYISFWRIPLAAAKPAARAGDLAEKLRVQIEHVRLGLACRMPNTDSAVRELIERAEEAAAALASIPATGGEKPVASPPAQEAVTDARVEAAAKAIAENHWSVDGDFFKAVHVARTWQHHADDARAALTAALQLGKEG